MSRPRERLLPGSMVAKYAKLEPNLKHPKGVVRIENATLVPYGPEHSFPSLLVLHLFFGREC